MWVDGTDAVTEGVWLTDSGDVMSYTGFTDKEPDGGVGENCIAVAVDSVIDIRCVRNAYVYYTLCELWVQHKRLAYVWHCLPIISSSI